jgi:hypothetical protein
VPLVVGVLNMKGYSDVIHTLTVQCQLIQKRPKLSADLRVIKYNRVYFGTINSA